MRLLVHVEGQTEETFVNTVLGPHLIGVGYSSVAARLIGSSVRRKGRGDGRSWQSVRQGIINHLRNDREAIATTMVDYYRMQEEWPGRARAATRPLTERATTVQAAVAEDIAGVMDRGFHRRRLIPYVSMHEFEALLFSDCQRFADGVGKPDIAHAMQEILDQFGNPEAINDSEQTAPSKRIAELLPTYKKATMGRPPSKPSAWPPSGAAVRTSPIG